MNQSSLYSGIPQRAQWVEGVGRDEVPNLLSSCGKVILLLGTTSPRSFLLPIVHHFTVRFGPDIRFGYFKMEGLSDRGFMMRFVRPVFRGEARRLRGARGGYYLFVEGQAAGFHRGLNDPRLDLLTHAASGPQPTQEALQRFRLLMQDTARSVVARFEYLLSPARRSGRHLICPYTVLGISPAATDAEVKTAYRQRMRQTHPDHLADRSEELQRRAHEQSQLVLHAYRQINEERRGG